MMFGASQPNTFVNEQEKFVERVLRVEVVVAISFLMSF